MFIYLPGMYVFIDLFIDVSIYLFIYQVFIDLFY